MTPPGSTDTMGSASTTTAKEHEQELDKAAVADMAERAERGPSPIQTDYSLKHRPWRWRRYITSWDVLAHHNYKGSGAANDPFVVTWLEGDAENPYNWHGGYKWFITMIGAFTRQGTYNARLMKVAVGMLSVTMGSSILSGAIQDVKREFPGHNEYSYIMGESLLHLKLSTAPSTRSGPSCASAFLPFCQSRLTPVTGIYILGFAVGPFLWAPYSEVFGRRSAFLITQIPFTAFDAAVCGSQSLYALLLLRFCAGIFGCCSMTNAGGIISDMFRAHQRGLAMGVFGAMPWLGPVVGPIVGGFLGQKAPWQWVAAVAAFFTAFLTFMHLVFLPETYAPVLLRSRAKTLTKADPGGRVYKSEQDVAKPFNTKRLVINQLKVPYILLFTEPIVFILCM